MNQATFEVRKNEIFGLIGPNGAGKTTLVKMLSTLILPTAGTATINGIPLLQADRIKPTIGLMTYNERSFFPRLTCNENLCFYGGLAQLSRPVRKDKIQRLAEMLDLSDFLDKRYDRCSTGMKHRLALARALLNDASLLFLDEPTAALDPVAAAQFRERLYALVHQEARAVLMVTHNMDEAVELCDRVAVMVKGRLYVVGTPDRLRPILSSEARCTLQVRGGSYALPGQLRDLGIVTDLTPHQIAPDLTRFEIQLQNRERSLPAIIAAVEADGGSLEKLQLATATWDEVAQQLAGNAAEGAAADSGTVESKHDPAVAHLSHHETYAVSQITHDPGPDSRRRRRFRLPKLDLRSRLQELRKTMPIFLQRDLRTQVSYRLSFLLQLVGIFFSVTSYYFVGQVFGMQTNPYLAAYGGDYFSFVLIGIAFLGYQSVALYGFSNVVQSAQTTGTLEAMLTTPTRLSTILLGSSTWNFIFTSFRVLLYLLAGTLFFGARFTGANWGAALLVLLLTVTSLSAIGILSASFIMVFKRGSPINFLISSVSLLLGGVYYPVEVLPAPLQAVARLYPLTTSLQAMRRALLMGASLSSLAGDLAILLGFTLLLMPLSFTAFGYAVQRAKRDGSLTQF
ncbi:MAG: ABC transporter ATP-binding protein/permease [Anaerolineae bacterium]|nr:ABC transporter ATP-binding protein/permease [Anaerolineae bacterium]